MKGITSKTTILASYAEKEKNSTPPTLDSKDVSLEIESVGSDFTRLTVDLKGEGKRYLTISTKLLRLISENIYNLQSSM